ncbi:thermonuclease family protein [Mycobacterium sp. 4D054]|mgnify:FL=1|jgi:micrococcal nuclease|uniref:thermonuclease family protein n=1 Tax=Mycobacterium sp. 4D054 TaxID=3457440 RepID=UPI000C94F2E2|nr:nuclease [Ahrensia sp.]MCB0937438.1 thermonuclease family protein [Mycobacterium sp.]MCB1286673.1 thermonuclease family protein [Mycobacterium sp.]TXH12431.1 MAG: nuclease [Gammaproteobacteria bacterium]
MRICLATALTVAATAAVAIPATACAAPVDAAPATATVLRVVDGDTVDVVDDARGRLRVRVLGIDTPETKGTEECWGRQATEFATATLMNRRVAVLGDASQDARDRYGRTYLH